MPNLVSLKGERLQQITVGSGIQVVTTYHIYEAAYILFEVVKFSKDDSYGFFLEACSGCLLSALSVVSTSLQLPIASS